MHHGAMEVHVESILHNYRCIINGEYNYISLPSEWLYMYKLIIIINLIIRALAINATKTKRSYRSTFSDTLSYNYAPLFRPVPLGMSGQAWSPPVSSCSDHMHLT